MEQDQLSREYLYSTNFEPIYRGLPYPISNKKKRLKEKCSFNLFFTYPSYLGQIGVDNTTEHPEEYPPGDDGVGHEIGRAHV